MASRTRTRFVRYGGELAGVNNGSNVYIPAKDGIRTITDEVHHGPPYRTGGPLDIRKVKFNIQRFPAFHVSQGPESFVGFLAATPYVPPIAPTASSLAGWGAKGWNRTVPTHPAYNLGVSLVELADVRRTISSTYNFFSGIRHLNFSKSFKTVGDFLHDVGKGTKHTAGDYLNLQFGWAPMVQDLAFIIDYQELLRKKLRELARNNGRPVRRKCELDASHFSEFIGVFSNRPSTLSPYIFTGAYADSSFPFVIPVTREVKTRIWYSAKYRFWIPEIAKTYLKASNFLKRKLSGLDLNPDVLYQAIPWTWLLDWFSSVGAVIKNLYNMARFGVIAEYAYVMGSEDYTYNAPAECDVWTGTYNYGTGLWPGKLKLRGSSQTVYEFRKREAANPFGFGITFSSLSNFQWSILLSLGITTRLR